LSRVLTCKNVPIKSYSDFQFILYYFFSDLGFIPTFAKKAGFLKIPTFTTTFLFKSKLINNHYYLFSIIFVLTNFGNNEMK